MEAVVDSVTFIYHMKQKYRLIIAISILKTKPENLSIENYINILRNKITNETNCNDLGTVCSDDFLFDEDQEAVCDTQINNNDTQTYVNVTQKHFKDTQIYDYSQDGQLERNTECNSLSYNGDRLEQNGGRIANIARENDSDKQHFIQYRQHQNHTDKFGLSKQKIERPTIKHLSDAYDHNCRRNVTNTQQSNTQKHIDTDKHANDTQKCEGNTQKYGIPQECVDLTQINDSMNIQQGHDVSHNVANSNEEISNSLDEVFKILRQIDDKDGIETHNTRISTNSDKTFCESQFNEIDMDYFIPENVNKPGSANCKEMVDSQQTEIYSLHGFTQQYTHISQSQTQHLHIPQKYIYGNVNKDPEENKNNDAPESNHNKMSTNEDDIFTQSQPIPRNCIINAKDNFSRSKETYLNNIDMLENATHGAILLENDYNATNITSQNNLNNSSFPISASNDACYTTNASKNALHSQKEYNAFNNRSQNAINKTSLKRSISNDSLYPRNFFEVTSRASNDSLYLQIEPMSTKLTTQIDSNAASQNGISDTSHPPTSSNNSLCHLNDFETKNIITRNELNTTNITTHDAINNASFPSRALTSFSCPQNDFISQNEFNATNITTHGTAINNASSRASNSVACPQNEFNATNITTHDTLNSASYPSRASNSASCHQNDSTLQNDLNATNITTEEGLIENMEIAEESRIEAVPFKIIEELNKVNHYLNRRFERRLSRDGYSTDSGYRSDTQGKYSTSSFQQSLTNLNQSGHSLFNYITSCHLVASTKDITNEISVVLGKLIDKLHEEENYPSFLEDLLDNVHELLRELYEKDDGEHVLLSKEVTIQRIVLLNKSLHIQKFTIEKVTNLLEATHKELVSKDANFEIQNINSIENLCYIFHILHVILPKFLKCREHYSQPSQASQDDEKLLRKSSITEIWRRKWNPNFKTLKFEGSAEKSCVLVKCSEVLNRIIVDCIDGYSLLAYFALKCFNLLQS